MAELELWKRIIGELTSNPDDFKTVPRINREPVWFYAETDGESIYVDKAHQKRPSCQIALKRRIKYSDFETVYRYFQRWNVGEVGVRDEVRQLSRNTAYIFALISQFNKA